MAKDRKNITRGGVHRVERAERQQKLLIIGAVSVLALVAFLVIGGTLYESYFRPLQTIATVGDEKITVAEFEARVRYERIQWVYRYSNSVETYEQLADNPEFQSQVEQQLYQIADILDPIPFAERILNQIIDERLIRQEANRRGITVTEAEIDLAVLERYSFFPNGTPTVVPTETLQLTSTLSSAQYAILTATPTRTVTPTFTPIIEVTSGIFTNTPTLEFTATPEGTATSGIPTLTPTVITTEMAGGSLADELDIFIDTGFNEAELRKLHEFDLYRQKLFEVLTADFKHEQEQVWVRHILVADEDAALDVIVRLEAGEDFSDLVEELSLNATSKITQGDLGWFSNSPQEPDYTQEFMDAAFALEIGEISTPVNTSSGWHVIQLLGKENRQIGPNDLNQATQNIFIDFLAELRESTKLDIDDNWQSNAPNEPDVPRSPVNNPFPQ